YDNECCMLTIGRMTTSGVVTNLYPFGDSTGLTPIGTGADDALWFSTLAVAPRVGFWSLVHRISPGGQFSTFSGEYRGIASITRGPDRAIWLTDSLDDSIDRVTPSGHQNQYFTLRNPDRITAGPDGALWVTNPPAGEVSTASVTRIATSGRVENV